MGTAVVALEPATRRLLEPLIEIHRMVNSETSFNIDALPNRLWKREERRSRSMLACAVHCDMVQSTMRAFVDRESAAPSEALNTEVLGLF